MQFYQFWSLCHSWATCQCHFSSHEYLSFALMYLSYLKVFSFPFAVSIDSALGPSMTVAGLDFIEPCFSHGQLYVALSPVGAPAGPYNIWCVWGRKTKNVFADINNNEYVCIAQTTNHQIRSTNMRCCKLYMVGCLNLKCIIYLFIIESYTRYKKEQTYRLKRFRKSISRCINQW